MVRDNDAVDEEGCVISLILVANGFCEEIVDDVDDGRRICPVAKRTSVVAVVDFVSDGKILRRALVYSTLVR